MFRNLFSDLKEWRDSRIYSALMLFRRNLLVMILIFGQSSTAIKRIAYWLVIQILYLSIIYIKKSFKKMIDNLIDIMNEIYFLVLLILLVVYLQKDQWDSTVKNMYLYIIISNSCVILVLMLGNSMTNI